MTSSSCLRDLFHTCDTRAAGRIGPPEFRDLCTNFGISPADADTIFADLDHDGDGQVDFNDFSHGFRDFLTPGSRRGSLQIPPHQHEDLHQMERRHNSARGAWKHFTTSVGISNVQPFIGDTGQELVSIVEELKGDEVGKKLEKALGSLITDVHTLHEEYRTLESSFRKEKETHAAQLAALGEELDQQLAKTEAKAKEEARQEAQRQMDMERKKIAMEMEAQMADLGVQLRNFQKVEEWLTEEEKRSGPSSLGGGAPERPVESSKLMESENRSLKSALVEAQMKAALLQSQLTQKRSEYQELVNDFHTEKMAACEYKTQVDVMQNHLSILNHANRVLSDANDCFSMATASHSSSPSTPLVPFEDRLPSPDTDKADSGRGTLLEELRAEEGKSPLPSGVWSGGAGGGGAVSSKPSSTCRSFEDVTEPHRAFKVILAGDAAVGKTTFIERVCQGHFTPNLSSTIGVDFRVKTLELDGVTVALQLWDTAGQERFRSLTKSYFRRADGVVLMYDVTNEATFVSIRHWVQNVEEGAGRKLPIVLCGNKSDLRDASSISAADGAKLASLCGALFIETSPKCGANVLEALHLLGREMRQVEDLEVRNSVRLEGQASRRKGGCCA